MRLVDLLPDAVRSYLRWFQLRRAFPQARLAQTAVVSRSCQLGQCVAIYPGAEVINSTIGRYSYVGHFAKAIHCTIGSFCSIAPTAIIGGYRHPTDTWVSTSPAFYSTRQQSGATFASRNEFDEVVETHIGPDVWIGYGAIILPGVTVGTGAIIGSGAVVTHNVAAYTIVAGVPARPLRQRFEPAQIQWLLASKWWEQSDAWLREHQPLFEDIQRMQVALNNLEQH